MQIVSNCKNNSFFSSERNHICNYIMIWQVCDDDLIKYVPGNVWGKHNLVNTGWCFSILPHFLLTEMVAKWYTAVISVLSVYYVATSIFYHYCSSPPSRNNKNFNEKLNNHKTVSHQERKRENKINWVYSISQQIN